MQIKINGEIGYNTTAASVAEQLSQATGDKIDLHISSPGGYVDEAFDIAAQLSNWRKAEKGRTIDVYLNGFVASAASFIAMIGDTIYANETTRFLIHMTWVIVAGNADDLRAMADSLKDYDKQIANIYAQRTGLDQNLIRDLMRQEKEMQADELIELGFADAKTEIFNTVEDTIMASIAIIDIRKKSKMKDSNKFEEIGRAVAKFFKGEQVGEPTPEKTPAQAHNEEEMAALDERLAAIEATLAELTAPEEAPEEEEEEMAEVEALKAQLEEVQKQLNRANLKKVEPKDDNEKTTAKDKNIFGGALAQLIKSK